MSTGPFQAYGRPERKSNSTPNPDAEAAGLPDGPVREAVVPRVFVREPGWHVALKVGSERTFCYFIAPGEDYYHRLADGEIYLRRGDERLCLPCAARRGLLGQGPRALRDRAAAPDLDTGEDDYDVLG